MWKSGENSIMDIYYMYVIIVWWTPVCLLPRFNHCLYPSYLLHLFFLKYLRMNYRHHISPISISRCASKKNKVVLIHNHNGIELEFCTETEPIGGMWIYRKRLIRNWIMQRGGWGVPRFAVGKRETQGEPMFLSSGPAQGRGSGLLLVGGPAYLFYGGLLLIRWGPPTQERAICFIQSTYSNINLP